MDSFVEGSSIIMFRILIDSFLQSNLDLGSSYLFDIVRRGSASFHQIFAIGKVIIVD